MRFGAFSERLMKGVSEGLVEKWCLDIRVEKYLGGLVALVIRGPHSFQ